MAQKYGFLFRKFAYFRTTDVYNEVIKPKLKKIENYSI